MNITTTKSTFSSAFPEPGVFPAPRVGAPEVRGLRPSDVGGVFWTWEVSMNLSTGRYSGQYEQMVILAVEANDSETWPRDRRAEQARRYRVHTARLRNGQFKVQAFDRAGQRQTRHLLKDGCEIPVCDQFGKALYMVAAPA